MLSKPKLGLALYLVVALICLFVYFLANNEDHHRHDWTGWRHSSYETYAHVVGGGIFRSGFLVTERRNWVARECRVCGKTEIKRIP